MRMKKLVIFATAATIGVVSLSTVTAVANAAPASPTTSKVQWGSCASASLQAAGAQCALLPVPLDYRHPHGTMIKLAISRIKHTVSDAKAQGLMLVNPGGPGGSGLSLSRLGAFVPKHAGDYYDWVGFDPRGVGSSQPAISCDPNYFGYNRPSYVPYTQALVDTWLARSRAYTAACAAKNGPILQHMTTVEAALDMDSIRRALGYKEINYYGFSYGTYLGQVYSTMFPGRVRRQVLDSNVDPRRVWYAANLDQDIAFEKNMKIWWAWVAKYDSVYHLGTTEAVVEALFYKIQDQLLKHPDQGKLGPDEWTDAFLYAGYYQVTW
jgi:pimeloyl-ACP methyl ester carboxylesterase